jgi:hypothetical protein
MFIELPVEKFWVAPLGAKCPVAHKWASKLSNTTGAINISCLRHEEVASAARPVMPTGNLRNLRICGQILSLHRSWTWAQSKLLRVRQRRSRFVLP